MTSRSLQDAEVPVREMREYIRLLDGGADRLPLPYAPRATFQAMLALLDRYVCPTCRLTPQGTIPEPCAVCVTGMLRGRIDELQGEFYYDFTLGVYYGRCGHRWRGRSFIGEACPFCLLMAKGRPKGLVRRALEAV